VGLQVPAGRVSALLEGTGKGTGKGTFAAMTSRRGTSATQPPGAPADNGGMPLDHHNLDVYRRALELLEACDEIARQLPRKRAHLRDQIDRAACSIVANIAEGAGEFSRKEKARFYRMARRSATEIGAWLDIVTLRREAEENALNRAHGDQERVVSMLVKLIQSCER
jgi:four helix bundle protein